MGLVSVGQIGSLIRKVILSHNFIFSFWSSYHPNMRHLSHPYFNLFGVFICYYSWFGVSMFCFSLFGVIKPNFSIDQIIALFTCQCFKIPLCPNLTLWLINHSGSRVNPSDIRVDFTDINVNLIRIRADSRGIRVDPWRVPLGPKL